MSPRPLGARLQQTLHQAGGLLHSFNPAARLPPPERRCDVSLARVSCRIGMSLVRSRWSRSPVVVVDVGGFRMRADLRTPMGLGLYRYGFCAAEARVCAKLLRAGDVFVDGGANVGLFALGGATIVGSTGHVIAVEPGPGTMKLLRANTECNDFAHVDLHEVALSDSAGVAEFTIFEDGSGLASFAPESEAGRSVQVAVTTLDSLTEAFGERVALVKLDVEGAEASALRGAADLISRAAPLFLVEVEPGHLARQGSSVEDVMKTLQPHGYEAYSITPDARLTRLGGPWYPPDPMRPNLVLAPSSRSARLRDLIGRGGS